MPISAKDTFKISQSIQEDKWQDSNGKIFEGGKTIEYPAPLEVIPYFKKVK